MKLLSILLYLCIMCFGNQKINTGIFEIDINSEQVDCELIINSDFTYEILLSYQMTKDILHDVVLSYGRYSVLDEQLILHDDYYNYEWNVYIKDNKIIVARGFVFLDGKTVSKYRNESIEITPPNDEYLGRIKAQIDWFLSQQDNPQMVAGQYEDQNHDNVLIINNDGKYQLYLKDVLLSEGHWNQKDNLLVLHDIQLNHDFNFAIGKRSLLSLGVPGDFAGTLFDLTKAQETKTPPRNRRGGCSRIK